MGTHYILIDYENVLPDDLAPLQGHPVRVFVFVGDPEASLPFELVSSLQALGDKATYVPINADGRSAIDLHIAFCLGRYAEQDRDGHFHVISRDTGFDPLVAYLRAEGVDVRRGRGLAELPFLGATAGSSAEDRIAEVVRSLHCRGLSRPRRRRTLMNTIHAHFRGELEFAEVTALVDQLIERGCLHFQGETVRYHPPITRR